ncbi:MAG TPA: hypothetical protein VFK68_05170 [Propionibacteriaceae bacterium]|nr:hypothetical protein [Propionibacteriaceae bacterium]
MKVLKTVLLVVGLLAVAGAAALLVKNAWDLRVLYEVAMANKSQPSVTDPTNLVLIGAGLAAVGGVVLGLGLGLPRRTAGAVRQETLEDLHRKTAADATAAEVSAAEAAPRKEHADRVGTEPADTTHRTPDAPTREDVTPPADGVS